MTDTKRHWSKLPPIKGFTRVEDRGSQRMCKCDVCEKVIPTLGVGYHQRLGKGCRMQALRNGRE